MVNEVETGLVEIAAENMAAVGANAVRNGVKLGEVAATTAHALRTTAQNESAHTLGNGSATVVAAPTRSTMEEGWVVVSIH